uniref:Craniofacial development protein 2-like n=1 Tax=Nicotiana tabacum TaxID=4097 RepID=A0A1S4CB95_TOBAC|nr:PREDICTED: uncharacterized protein LOC107817153 [Nicotiana tabacum]
MGKSIELAKVPHKRKIDIASLQETRWVGDKAQDVDGFKLWYSGHVRCKNGVGILVDSDLRKLVVEVKRVSDRLIGIKLVVRLFIGGDFNRHIGVTSGDYDDVHRGFGFRVRNGGGISLLDFAKVFDLVIANSSFLKKEEHLVAFKSLGARTHIDYTIQKVG